MEMQYVGGLVLEKKTEKKIGTSQKQTDHRIEEDLPKIYKCPVCSAPVKQVIDKRGIYWKCQNEDCRWDSARPFDWNKEARKNHILDCTRILKQLFPQFNFVTNFPYSPEMPLTGRIKKGRTHYDISIFFMGNKLQRARIEINQNLTKKQFFESDFCYVIGVPETVDYLASRDGLVIHYLVDEKKNKVLISKMKKVVDNCSMRLDSFGNYQYFIEKEKRSLLVVDDLQEMKKIFFENLYKFIYKEIEIL